MNNQKKLIVAIIIVLVVIAVSLILIFSFKPSNDDPVQSDISGSQATDELPSVEADGGQDEQSNGQEWTSLYDTSVID